MIYIFLRGGFANLYFQLAFASHLSFLTGRDIKVLGNCKHPVLKTLYDDFFYDDSDERSNFNEQLLCFINNFPVTFIRLLRKCGFLSRQCVFCDTEIPSGSLAIVEKIKVIDSERDIYLYGYWQNFPTSFYQRGIPGLKKILLEKVSSKSDKRGQDSGLAIHVRLGDYYKFINRIRFNNIDEKYYLKWITFFVKNFGFESVDVYTDDVNNERLVRLLRNARITYPEIEIRILASDDLFLDLVSLSDYKYRIIGNSTYGALAGYLSIPRVTVTPKKWYNFRNTVVALPFSIYSLD